ncbi:MAG TPA: membrane protein insertase YidC [Steroidobacteraceae bacterium]|nr:membrane protein insertase YidC [Steroidobacteraceae bacterium]
MTANLRVFLWVMLGMALFVNYQAWMHDYPSLPASSALHGQGPPAATLDSSAPTASVPSATAPSTAAPSTAAPTTASSASGGTSAPAAAAAPAAQSLAESAASGASAAAVHVRTDVLDVQVSLAGGELERLDLPAYPQAKNTPDIAVRLLNRDNPDSLFVLQSGLAGSSGEAAPTHQAAFTSDAQELRLMPGQEQLRLPLHWSDGHGVSVTKTLTFHRGRYEIGLDYLVHNDAAAPWSFAPYEQILRYNTPIERSYFRVDSYAFKGPAISDGKKFEKLDITKGATLDQSVTAGWIAALQQHFLAAIVPPSDVPYRFALKTQGNEFLLSATGPSQTVAPGADATAQASLWVGPKLQAQLDQVGPKLSLVTDYGKLSVLATPLFWLLDRVHRLVGNWGFTIIIVTLLLKLLFYPLSEASGRSMAKMKALAPRLNSLRETYKDDREKLNRSMMELYQREKVNPLAGCLPMLIQIPVFLAFYWVLRDSVEIRQAPFIFWINDLSSRDPLFVLPALMAVAMFVQYKLNPQVGDPMQQKVFMFMPLAMSATFAFFPAGLVLYWVTNTVLSILQQWNINRRIVERSSRAQR